MRVSPLVLLPATRGPVRPASPAALDAPSGGGVPASDGPSYLGASSAGADPLAGLANAMGRLFAPGPSRAGGWLGQIEGFVGSVFHQAEQVVSRTWASFVHPHDAPAPAPAPTPAPAPAPTPAPAPAPAPTPARYTVRPGDSLGAIARRTLGNANRWPEIYAANRDQLNNPNLIFPGQVLRLPTGSAAAPAPAPATPVAGLDIAGVARVLGVNEANLRANWPYMASALAASGMADRASLIAVLATVKTEVGAFQPIPEYGSGSEYNGRADLGNTQSGDGPRYKGRGYIQLTGRANYRAYGQKLGLDLEGNPDLALDPNVAGRVLVRYFADRGIPAMARSGDWQGVRRAVNGGLNGWSTFSDAVNQLSAHPELFR